MAADVGGMVEEALRASRRGNILARTWRRLTGGEVDADIAPRTTYSKAAAVRLLDRVRAAVDRPATDAKISFSAAGVAPVPSRDGLAVDASALHRRIRAAIVDPRADHRLVARTHHVRPKVTTDELAARTRPS